MTKKIGKMTEKIKTCVLHSLVGERLGGGSTRQVFALLHRPDMVLKVEQGSDFCNIHEWEVWLAVKDTPNAVFFAPCEGIDSWGAVLIQRRTQPITKDEFEAEVKELPHYLTDNHWANFGRLDGRIVCHDYGYTDIFEGARSKRRKKIHQ